MSLILGGNLDPRLLGEVGDLVLSTYLYLSLLISTYLYLSLLISPNSSYPAGTLTRSLSPWDSARMCPTLRERPCCTSLMRHYTLNRVEYA
jgi:hypothetical protein